MLTLGPFRGAGLFLVTLTLMTVSPFAQGFGFPSPADVLECPARRFLWLLTLPPNRLFPGEL